MGVHSCKHAHERSGIDATFINQISWFERDSILLKYEVNNDSMNDREIHPPNWLQSGHRMLGSTEHWLMQS